MNDDDNNDANDDNEDDIGATNQRSKFGFFVCGPEHILYNSGFISIKYFVLWSTEKLLLCFVL